MNCKPPSTPVKALETDVKDRMDSVKGLVTITKATFSMLNKKSRDLLKEAARQQSQQEKERLAAEKQKGKDEKARLRNVADQMKGADKLPGLLSYCGDWVKPMAVFGGVEDYRIANHDSALPCVISDIPSLKVEEATPAAKVNFALFKAGAGELRMTPVTSGQGPPPLGADVTMSAGVSVGCRLGV